MVRVQANIRRDCHGLLRHVPGAEVLTLPQSAAIIRAEMRAPSGFPFRKSEPQLDFETKMRCIIIISSSSSSSHPRIHPNVLGDQFVAHAGAAGSSRPSASCFSILSRTRDAVSRGVSPRMGISVPVAASTLLHTGWRRRERERERGSARGDPSEVRQASIFVFVQRLKLRAVSKSTSTARTLQRPEPPRRVPSSSGARTHRLRIAHLAEQKKG